MAINMLNSYFVLIFPRFCQTGMWRQKNSAYVDFPTENVDFHKFVSGPQQRKLFSLFAVSVCHYSINVKLLTW